MSGGYVRAYRQGDAEMVGANLRIDDRLEAYAHSGLSPIDAILYSVGVSELACTICTVMDHPAAVFGVGEGGTIWLLGTDELTHNALCKQFFLRASRRYLDGLQERYPVLHNVIDERNITHIRWLQWLGCTFIHRHPHFGFEQRPFLEFVRM